jgi:transcriptional regulator with XRE-family HTH domain
MFKAVTKEESEPLYQSLISALKAHRLANNLTQLELAQGTGLSLTTIRRFESGEEISAKALLNIVNFFGFGSCVQNWIPEVDIAVVFKDEIERLKSGGGRKIAWKKRKQ